MRIITAYTKHNFGSIIDVTLPRLLRYATNHRIDCTAYIIPEDYGRPPPWYKVYALIEELRHQDYVLWIDADTLIVNQGFDLRSIVVPDKEFYVANDFNGMNTGVMMWKGGDYSVDFLQRVYSMTDFLNHIWWEQAAIRDLYNVNHMNIQGETQFMDQSVWNAYEFATLGMPPQVGQADASSFILHLPNIRNDVRLQTIKQYIERYGL